MRDYAVMHLDRHGRHGSGRRFLARSIIRSLCRTTFYLEKRRMI